MEPRIAEQFTYRWVILIASFFIRTIVFGALFSVGVVYVEWLNEFGAGRGETAWIGSLATGSCLLAGPIGGALLSRFTCRTVTFGAGFLMAIGLTCSVFAPNIYYLYVSYGLIAGFSGGVANIAGVVIVVEYFDRQRALAVGIGSSGVGLGAFAFSVLQRKLMEEYGWRGSMAIVGAIASNICVFGLLLLHPDKLLNNTILGRRSKAPFPARQTEVTILDLDIDDDCEVEIKQLTTRSVEKCKEDPNVNINNNRIKRRRSTFQKIRDKLKFTETTISLWQDPMFLLLFVSDFMSWLVQFVPYVHLPQRAITLGFTANEAAILLSVMGLMGAVGKTVFGCICTFLQLEPYRVFTVAQILFGVSTILSPLCQTYTSLMIFAISFGFLSGAYALMLVIPADVLGPEKFSASYGLLLAGEGIGVYLGPPIVGWLSDYNHSYDFSFYCAGAVLLFSGLILLLRPLLEKPKQRQAWKR